MVILMLPPQTKATKSFTPESLPDGLLAAVPFIGFGLGLLLWLLDAAIDVYLLHPRESFLEAVLDEAPTEMWMRILVVVVMTGSALFAQWLLKRQKQTELLLRKHQNRLEELVVERTRKLQDMANLDPLTGIYNRRKFAEVLTYEIERSHRYQQSLSLVMCDLDYFKQINDQYGHQAGDKVLVSIAECLRQLLRKTDVFARWGGEEFIILLPHTNLDEAAQLAEKIRTSIAEIGRDNGIKVTASFGVSQFHPNEDEIALLKRVDDALYEGKHNGRNQVVVLQ
jgi:diguanylate cyclase (GGDEF)-like protein